MAQTEDGIVIVDQHAAHERLVYERLKRERDTAGIARQLLLIPEVVDLDPVDADRVVNEAEILEKLGLVVEPFGLGALLVREVPSALAGGRIKALVQDVADALAEWGEGVTSPVETRLDAGTPPREPCESTAVHAVRACAAARSHGPRRGSGRRRRNPRPGSGVAVFVAPGRGAGPGSEQPELGRRAQSISHRRGATTAWLVDEDVAGLEQLR